MNRILIALFSAFSLTGFQAAAQRVLSFDENSSASFDLHKSFTDYHIVTLTGSPEAPSDGERLSVRMGSTRFSFTLQDSKLFAPNYTVSVRGPRGVQHSSLQEVGFDGAYFTNTGLSAADALVLSVFDNQYSIFLRQGGAEWYIEPLSAYIPSAPQQLYVQYKKEDVAVVDAHCGNAPIASHLRQNLPNGGSRARARFNTELAIGCDYSMFQEYGSVAAVINRTATITNLTRADFTIMNGLQEDIGFQIVEHCIATCDAANPWTATNSVGTNLTNFRLGGPALFRNTYDLAQWWINDPSFSGGAVGMAYVGAVGNSFRYNTIIDFSVNTATMRQANSHQIGHNFDCGHDDLAGSGTIMSPAVSSSGSWSALNISEIGAFAPTIACLAAYSAPVASTSIPGAPTGTSTPLRATGRLTVYPNPVSETIFISGLQQGDEIRVLNNLGRVVTQQVAGATLEEIDVRSWTPGVYLVQVGDTVVRVVRE